MPGYEHSRASGGRPDEFHGEPGGGPMRYPIAIADMTWRDLCGDGNSRGAFLRGKKQGAVNHRHGPFRSQLTWPRERWEQLSEREMCRRNAWGNAHPKYRAVRSVPRQRRQVFVVGVGTEALWKRFVQLMNIQDDIGRDDRFTTNVAENQT